MTALAAPRQRRRARAAAGCVAPPADGPEPTLFDERAAGPGREPTLEALVAGVWEGLVAHRRVPCPLCGGEMAPRYGAHVHTVAGRCADCGTSLS